MHELSGFKAPFKPFKAEEDLRADSYEPYDASADASVKPADLGHSGRGVTTGWSALGGQTSSAYVFGGFEKGGNPMGSSSGSAVGLSAGWCGFALGTDTTGSVVSGLRQIIKSLASFSLRTADFVLM